MTTVRLTVMVEVHDSELLARKAEESMGEPVETLYEQVAEVLLANGAAPLDCGIEIIRYTGEV